MTTGFGAAKVGLPRAVLAWLAVRFADAAAGVTGVRGPRGSRRVSPSRERRLTAVSVGDAVDGGRRLSADSADWEAGALTTVGETGVGAGLGWRTCQ